MLEAALPQPCVNPAPGCSGVVEPGDVWDVAHRGPGLIDPDADVHDYGAAHRYCNRRAGGILGASIRTAHNQTRKRLPRW